MSAYNPYAPPTAPASPGGRRDGAFASQLGGALVVSKEAPLPDVCVKCAKPSSTRRTQRFVYTPQWVIVVMLLSLLIGAIIALIVQKRGTLHLPLCAECDRKWRSANLWTGLAVVGMIAFIVIGIVVGASNDMPALMLVFVVLGIGALVAVAIATRDVRVVSKKVDDRAITLIKVHPDAQRAIVAALS